MPGQAPSARELLRASGRFALAAALLATLLAVGRPLLYPAFARLARNVAVLTTPDGLVTGLHWSGGLERFVLDSLALGVSVHVGSLSLVFILVVPAAFTWALPAPGRLRATALQLLVCSAVGSTILSQDLLALVGRALGEHGVEVFGPWRSAFHAWWLHLGWDFAMIGVPMAACVAALLPHLEASPGPGTRPSLRRVGLAAAVGLALLATADRVAQQRLVEAVAQERFLTGLAQRDPDVPAYFLERAVEEAARGRLRDARAHLERAALFPSTRAQAERGLAELRAARASRASR